MFKPLDVEALLEDLIVELNPFGDRIAVLPDLEDEVSAGGIILPNTVEAEKKMAGTVIAIGAGQMTKTGDWVPEQCFKKGDRVMFGKYVGDDVTLLKKDGSKVTVKILHMDGVLSFCTPKPL